MNDKTWSFGGQPAVLRLEGDWCPWGKSDAWLMGHGALPEDAIFAASGLQPQAPADMPFCAARRGSGRAAARCCSPRIPLAQVPSRPARSKEEKKAVFPPLAVASVSLQVLSPDRRCAAAMSMQSVNLAG